SSIPLRDFFTLSAPTCRQNRPPARVTQAVTRFLQGLFHGTLFMEVPDAVQRKLPLLQVCLLLLPPGQRRRDRVLPSRLR
ncbi:MAG: hypothetical protein EBS90_07890, partial [Betaproteobacteria bacterium]|nr:hypothetical protein [Betaproteobacteria bacterium]